MRRFLAALLLALSLAGPALAASPTIGAATSGGFQGGSTSGNVTKTCAAGDTVFVAAFLTSQVALRTGSVSGASLTWTMSSRVQHTSGSTRNNSELWYAYTAAGFTSQSITLTASAATDATEFSAFCVSGADSSNQLDPNASLPATYNAGSGTTFTYSTTNADDLIISFRGKSDNGESTDIPTGFTNLVHAVNSSGAVRYANVHVDYKSVSAAQGNVTSAYLSAGEVDASILVAATADPTAPPGVAGARALMGVGN